MTGDNTASIDTLAFSPDGTLLVATCRSSSTKRPHLVSVWEVATWQHLTNLRCVPPGHQIPPAAFSPDSAILATGGDRVRLWDVTTWQELLALPHGLGNSRHLNLWDSASGQRRAELLGRDGKLTTAVYSPDGKSIAIGEHDGTLRLADSSTPEETNGT